jgi:hypothetical protein
MTLTDILDKDDSDDAGETARAETTIDYEYEYKRLLVEVSALRSELRDRSGDVAQDENSANRGTDAGAFVKGEDQALQAEEEALDAADAEMEGESGQQQRIKAMAAYVPLRLSLTERKQLHLLEGALSVSQYVDKVDDYPYKSRTGRMVAMVREVCALLCGLLVASDYKLGQATIENKNYADNQRLFQTIFEVGRRHKIMNPDKMRANYGKLIFLLQDAQAREVAAVLGFSTVSELNTVEKHLRDGGASALLDDPLIALASAEIEPFGRDRLQIARDIKHKEAAIEHLASKYGARDHDLSQRTHAGGGGGVGGESQLDKEEIRRCLYSLGDCHAFLRVTRAPCEQMLTWLREEFDPANAVDPYSLAILGGREGARLTHSHSKQVRETKC